MRDQQLQELETELRRTADDLHRLCDKPAPVVALVAEHRRRQGRRLVRLTAGIVCPLLIIAVMSLTGVPPFSKSVSSNHEKPAIRLYDGPPRPSFSQNSPASTASVDHRTDLETQRGESTTNPVQEEPVDVPSVPSADSPASNTAAPVFIPIVLAPGQHGGESVITTAIYIPEHTESLNLQDLSPAEQSAVRRVLGLDQQVEVQLSL
jgi:hypothetical protein